jgi:hypothetical protein
MPLERITNIYQGTGSFATGSSTSALYIECLGGGGGGGGASGLGISGGGGGGAYSALFIPSGSVSESGGSLSCSVGAGGGGGLGTATRQDYNTGSAGSDTWFEPSASRCLAKGGSGGQGAASPKGGGGGLASLGTGSLKVDGASGTVGFQYQDPSTRKQAQSGDGADGFFGGGAPGINSKVLGHPLARSGSLYGSGGGGANRDRGGPGSAGLIRVWEYSD